MALGKIEVTENERDLHINPDRVICNCHGRFGNGTEFKIFKGALTVREVGAADFIDAKPDEIRQVRQALEDRFGERFKANRVQINDAGQFVLLDTAPPTAAEQALRENARAAVDMGRKIVNAAHHAALDVSEYVGIPGAVVRRNGMVSMVREVLERNQNADLAQLAEDLRTNRIFSGLPDLQRLVDVAIREGGDNQRNITEDFQTVSALGLDGIIATRLDNGEAPDDIRRALRGGVTRVAGRQIARSRGEVESIFTIAFERAEALRKVRANKKARADKVKGAAKRVVDFANEAVGTTPRIVRENGMVTHAGLLLETQNPVQVAEAFKTDPRFSGLANLPELTRVALAEVVNERGNQAAAEAILVRDNLVNIIADRLNAGESVRDIRASLDYRHFTPATGGAPIQRGIKEINKILDLAMARGQAAYEGRKKESAGSLNVAARNNGMVSMVRGMAEGGHGVDDIRAELRKFYTGTADLSDLIDTALLEYRNADRNRNWALVIESRLGLGARIADRLHRGDDRTAIERDIDNELVSFRVDGVNVFRSRAEITEIITAAFAEAARIAEKREKVKEATLVSRANEMGMVVEAARRIYQEMESPVEAEKNLIKEFPVDGARELAAIAVRDAQDVQKVYWTLYRRLERNNEAARILTERAGGVTPDNIRDGLTNDYGSYTAPGGRSFQLCNRDIDEMLRAADAQADALGRNRAAEVVKDRNAKHLKNTVKAWVPGTEQAAWDKRLVELGIIRYIRKEMEDEIHDEDYIRNEVEIRLARESDAEGMAIYAMARASDSAFARKQADRVAFMESFDTWFERQLALPPATPGGLPPTPAGVEALLEAHIKSIHTNISTAEAKEIAAAARLRVENKQNWQRRGTEAATWARGPGWEGLKTAGKYGAMGAGLLGLGTVAVGTVGTVLAGVLGWKALKWGWNAAKSSLPYALPMAAAGVSTVLDATVGGLKLVRNAALYGPATFVGNTALRAFHAARAAWNYPTPAREEKPLIKEKKGIMYPFTALGNLLRSTTTGAGNFLRGAYHRTKQGLLIPLALAAGLTVGAGEGLGKAGHHIFGYDWNGSQTLDHLAEETSHAPAAPAPHGHPAPAHAPKAAGGAAPAAHH